MHFSLLKQPTIWDQAAVIGDCEIRKVLPFTPQHTSTPNPGSHGALGAAQRSLLQLHGANHPLSPLPGYL
ncbi:hypothetical protein AGIG_G17488 [Arapaima gigas]